MGIVVSGIHGSKIRLDRSPLRTLAGAETTVTTHLGGKIGIDKAVDDRLQSAPKRLFIGFLIKESQAHSHAEAVGDKTRSRGLIPSQLARNLLSPYAARRLMLKERTGKIAKILLCLFL